MKYINRISSRFLRDTVKVLLFLLALSVFGGTGFLIGRMLILFSPA